MKREIIYKDAPAEADEAIEYAIKNNLFVSRQEFERLLEQSKRPAPNHKRNPRFSLPSARKTATL